MPEAAWSALAAVMAAALAAFTTHRIQRRKSDAETTEIVDRIAREWITTLQGEVVELRKRLDSRDHEVEALTDHVALLESHISQRKPPPPPARPRFV